MCIFGKRIWRLNSRCLDDLLSFSSSRLHYSISSFHRLNVGKFGGTSTTGCIFVLSEQSLSFCPVSDESAVPLTCHSASHFSLSRICTRTSTASTTGSTRLSRASPRPESSLSVVHALNQNHDLHAWPERHTPHKSVRIMPESNVFARRERLFSFGEVQIKLELLNRQRGCLRWRSRTPSPRLTRCGGRKLQWAGCRVLVHVYICTA